MFRRLISHKQESGCVMKKPLPELIIFVFKNRDIKGKWTHYVVETNDPELLRTTHRSLSDAALTILRTVKDDRPDGDSVKIVLKTQHKEIGEISAQNTATLSFPLNKKEAVELMAALS